MRRESLDYIRWLWEPSTVLMVVVLDEACGPRCFVPGEKL